MASDVTIALIGAATSIVTGFGSIVLSRYLDRRQAPAAERPSTEAPAAESAQEPTPSPPAQPTPAIAAGVPRVAHPLVIMTAIGLGAAIGAGTGYLDAHRREIGTIGLSVVFAVVALLAGLAVVLIVHAYRAGRRRSLPAVAFVVLEALAVTSAIGVTYAVTYRVKSDELGMFASMFIGVALIQGIAAAAGFANSRR